MGSAGAEPVNRTGEARATSEDCEDKYAEGLTSILNIPSAMDAEGKPVAHVLRLSRAAHAEWREFDRHNEESMRPGGDFENAKSWAGKAPGAAVRVAGVLHVMTHIEPWSSEITVETMTSALELMAVFGKHTLAALDLMGADESVDAARRVWGWIEAGHRHEVTLRDIHQALKGSFPHAADVREAVDVLVERGYVEVLERPAKATGRPASPAVVVRPDIVGGWR